MPPTNDNIANAVALSPDAIGSVQGDNTGGTLESGEAACLGYDTANTAGGLGYGGGRSVWFKLTASVSDDYTFQTGNPTAGTPIGDTLLTIINGSDFGTASILATEDDHSGLGGYSQQTVTLTVGQTVWIAVDGYNGNSTDDMAYDVNATAEGAFTLSWEIIPEIYDSFENSSIDYSSDSFTIGAAGWKMNTVGVTPGGDPNAAGTPFSIATPGNVGSKALKVVLNNTGSHAKLLYHAGFAGFSYGRTHTLTYRFMVPDFSQIYASSDWLYPPDLSSSSVGSGGMTGPFISALSNTTGRFTGAEVVDPPYAFTVDINQGTWHEYRMELTVNSIVPNVGTIVNEWFDGVHVTSNEIVNGGHTPPLSVVIPTEPFIDVSGASLLIDPVTWTVQGIDPITLAPVVFSPLAPNGSITVFVDRVDVTSCVLSGSVTRKLNRPWQATWRMPIDCSVQGPDSWVHIFISGILWFSGRIKQISDECDEDFCYTEYTALDASEILAWRPVRDDTCDFSDPQLIADYVTGPQILADAFDNSENCDAGNVDPDNDREGPLFFTVTSVAGGGVDLTGAPVDWPMTIAELMTMFTDTGEVDAVFTPIDDTSNLAECALYNGDYGTDRTASVKFEYATGNNNCKIIRQVQDSANICNKLWYFLGPKVATALDPQSVQHWQANVTGDDGALADPPQTAILADRATSRALSGVRMEVKIFDSIGNEALISHELYRRLWQEEQWLRERPRTLVHVTPVNLSDADLLPAGVTPVQLGDFDIGDLVTVSVGTTVRGGFTGAQRIYEYTVAWDEDGVFEISELLTSADQEGI